MKKYASNPDAVIAAIRVPFLNAPDEAWERLIASLPPNFTIDREVDPPVTWDSGREIEITEIYCGWWIVNLGNGGRADTDDFYCVLPPHVVETMWRIPPEERGEHPVESSKVDRRLLTDELLRKVGVIDRVRSELLDTDYVTPELVRETIRDIQRDKTVKNPVAILVHRLRNPQPEAIWPVIAPEDDLDRKSDKNS